MSKIYEALRQAELDRGSRAGHPAPGVDHARPEPAPAPSDVAVLDSIPDSFSAPAPTVIAPPPYSSPSGHIAPPPPSSAPSSVFAGGPTSALVSEPIPVPADRIDQLASVPVDPHALDLTGIKALRWNPALDQLPALHEGGSSVEQFRSLRSRMFEFRDLSSLKSILVSSGMPQEGKTFIAANLAVAFARHKAARVLLIDGDMRRSRLHTIFGTTQGPGLTEYLSGKSSLSEVMQRPETEDPEHPVPAGLGSLTFIPGGLDHSKAADLSGNHRFDRLMESVAPFFDWIIVDSSPVNLVSDGINLARACDGVLLVARGAVTKYEAAQRALGELKASKVLGFVLNAVQDPSEAGYYSYGNYEPYFNPGDVPEEPMVASAT